MSSPSSAPQSMMAPALGEAAGFLERTLDTLLPKAEGPLTALTAGMRQAVTGEGGAFRSFLVLQSGRLFGVDRRPLARVCAAVECIAAAARRHAGDAGFDALTGEALLAEAFAMLGSSEAIADPYIRAELMARLAACAGRSGLVGGLVLEQAAAQADAAPSLPEIGRLQRMKTAALVSFCCEAGAMLGHASVSARHALSAYGQDLGFAVQIAADLAAPEPGKATVVAALGTERAQAQAEALAAQAVRHLDLFDEKADLLRAAARYAVTRRP